MRKKIIGIFVCMLLIISALPMISSIDKNIGKNDYNEFMTDEIIMDDDCGCGNSNGIRQRIWIMEELPEPLDFKEASTKPTVMDTPDYFNWMDYEGYDWTTPAMDQGNCGSCYLCSALGALESTINIKEGNADLDLDLSEQYVLSCLPAAGNCKFGGWSWWVFHYIKSNLSSGNCCNGIIPESCFPYRAIDKNGCDAYDCDHDPVLCDEKCENWEEYLIPILDYGYWKPSGSAEDIEAIKTQIMEGGPVTSSIMVTYYIHGKDNFLDWGFEHHDPDDYYPYPGPTDDVNHIITIVGWKDDPLIGNGGYWICKNSWGQDWGYNGFFNVEYGSLNIDSYQIAWVEYNPDDIVNWLPVIDAGGPYYEDVGEEVTFDGSGCFDHEGDIISCEWEFGDGNNESGMITTNTYDSIGVYTVTLIVTDNDGNTVNDTTWAFIGRSNDPPDEPTIKGPRKGKNETEYDYTFSAIDPDGDDLYYYIYWGDMEPLELWIGPYSSGDKIILNHTWVEEGNYTIKVKAKDCYGFKSDWATRDIKMPKNKQFIFNFPLLSWLFDRFPNAFPILRYMLGM